MGGGPNLKNKKQITSTTKKLIFTMHFTFTHRMADNLVGLKSSLDWPY